MARAKSVWGVDIGQCALKALKLRDVDGQFQVEAFEVIEHPEHLRGPEADKSEVFLNALGQFLAKNDVSGSSVAVSVPGQSSFMRFVKLPPVETKRIPSIVKFEAEQQIPFPIDEVVWRWQTFHDPDSPDVEVGIFAMKRMEVAEMLSMMAFADLKVDLVQMAPLALYNFMCADNQLATDGATLLADVGADKTDLVVADGPRIWTRTIQIGGNNFTEALVRAFKLSFGKAENLKRTAATSKYARQVFQAMRPVFADLVQEIQRSIGYYTSLHRESRFKRVLGMGNGFRLPGLQKFLEQNLNIPVVKIDNFNSTDISPTLSEPTFAEDVLSFGVAYGLALQGLGEATVSTNLLPDEVVRKRVWDSKRPWFAAAAAALLVAMSCWVYRGFADRLPYYDNQPGTDTARTKEIIEELETLQKENKQIGDGETEIAQMKGIAASYGYRNTWPSVLSMFAEAVESVASDNDRYKQCAKNRAEAMLLTQELKRAAVKGSGVSAEKQAELKDKLAKLEASIDVFSSVDRSSLKIMTIESLKSEYSDDAVAMFPEDGVFTASSSGNRRGFFITTELRTTVDADVVTYMASLVKKCRAITKRKHRNLGFYGGHMTQKISLGGTEPRVAVKTTKKGSTKKTDKAEPEDDKMIDPITGQDMSTDQRVIVQWVIIIENDGVKYPSVK
ncbi:MAG: type IV pilus assembly protein PilM [Phycisphaerales bacterium]|jgi:type IV pilus assembly protein PilM|nr:type IV pilus assembly protein PilM [Phycisphaerales bacterium]